MVKGRRPTPTRVKKGAGKPIQSEIPTCPDWLKGVAKKEWDRVVPLLAKHVEIKVVDSTALAAYCQCYARWVEAEADVNRKGLMVETSRGRTVNPAAKHAELLLRQIRAWCAEFGFTPSSRGRMEVAGGPVEPDALDEFLSAGEEEDT